MSTEVPACPENENATDCLLRAVLRVLDDQARAEDAKFDWGPITFAFTVPIGIIAALFALVTIFQAVLAAGPGRRKSNNTAIGEWRVGTRRSWSWADMTMLSIARTPVLRTKHVQDLLKRRQPERAVPVAEEAAASWCRMLRELGLWSEGFALNTTRETHCDYLPDDLRAAPAYGEVGCIIAMAAAIGAKSFRSDPQSAYPIIVGDGFQFDFRQHPVLGTVGAFSRSPGVGRNAAAGRAHVWLAFLHAEGRIETIGNGNNKVSFVDAVKQAAPGKIISDLHRQGCTDLSGNALCHLKSLCNRPDNHHLLWLFAAAVPSSVPAVFPVAAVSSPNVLSGLALSSRFWRAPRKVRRLEQEPSILPNVVRWQKGAFPSDVGKDDIEYLEKLVQMPPGSVEQNDRITIDLEVLESDEFIGGLHEVFDACLLVLYNMDDFHSWFGGRDDSEKSYFRALVLLQLTQVDKWLAKCNAAPCRAVTLCLTTLALLDTEMALADGSFRSFSENQLLMGGESNISLEDDDRYIRDGPWREMMPQAESAHSNLPVDVTIQHRTTIQALGALADVLYARGTSPHSPKADYLDKFRTKLLYVLGRDSLFDSEVENAGFAALLSNIRRITHACLEAQTDMSYNELLQKRKTPYEVMSVDRLRLLTMYHHADPEPLPKDDETIDDMLVWKCILVALLFGTAPDNSTVLGSGLWNHVIPIL